jgi:DNA (cytosine-5)-methyltransferase 1
LIVKTIGSVCSGIEAASVAWSQLGLTFNWFSEVATFPSMVLNHKYPKVCNLGDMSGIPQQLLSEEIVSPDLICGGTPCQAFSLAGWKTGLEDDRGNLTLTFVDIINANDVRRKAQNKRKTVVFWENVEGVLTDKTNAFGCLISSLAGFSHVLSQRKWPKSGIIHGPERNIAWRVLDAKFFGVPQQRRRLYLMAGDTDFYPENIIFERHTHELQSFPSYDLIFKKYGHQFEIFREYTDCLYSAYGTKWNGNAAANNGSLFILQNNRLRRLSPLEVERLMGFPDDYTLLPKAKRTNRYKAIGNSWAVPVVRWIGQRLLDYTTDHFNISQESKILYSRIDIISKEGFFLDLGQNIVVLNEDISINCTAIPEECKFSSMADIVSPKPPEEIFISPVGCFGILRRQQERKLKMNARLSEVLLSISSEMSPEEIEKRSRIQKRGRFSFMSDESPISYD